MVEGASRGGGGGAWWFMKGFGLSVLSLILWLISPTGLQWLGTSTVIFSSSLPSVRSTRAAAIQHHHSS